MRLAWTSAPRKLPSRRPTRYSPSATLFLFGVVNVVELPIR